MHISIVQTSGFVHTDHAMSLGMGIVIFEVLWMLNGRKG